MNQPKDVDLGVLEEIDIGLSWDMFDPSNPVDLDASCVLFTNFGQIHDAVYYNQLKIDNVTHSGDNTTGEGEGFDEVIHINFKNLNKNVVGFMIVITCYSGGTFLNVETAQATIVNSKTKQTLSKISLGVNGKHTAFLYSVIYKDFGMKNWTMRSLATKAMGKNFQDVEVEMKRSLEFFIPKEIQMEVAWDPKSMKRFDLKKGQVIRLTSLGSIFLGLGWDTSCDLDSSCVMFDKNGNCIEDDIVYFGKLKSYNNSVVHSGDNLTGEGSGDDERIRVELSKVKSNVAALFFVITIYSTSFTFDQVSGAYVRLVDNGTNKAVCNYKLSQMGSKTAQVMSVVFRDPNGIWRMKALGEATTGREAKNKQIKEACARLLPLVCIKKTSPVAKRVTKYKEKKQKLETIPPVILKLRETKLNIKCHAKGVDKMDKLGKSDPYFIIFDDQKDVKIYKSETKKISLNPDWKEFMLSKINPHMKLRIEVYDWDRFSKDDFIGEFKTTLQEVYGGKKSHDLITRNQKKKSKIGYKNSGVFTFDNIKNVEFHDKSPNPKYESMKRELDYFKVLN